MSSKSLRALGLGTLLIAIVAGSPGQAEAQRTGTSSFILSLGGVDVLLAATATVGRTPLGPRLDPTGTNRITFTGLRPAGGADDGDCGFEEGTCDGEVKGSDPTAPGGKLCFKLYDVAITSSLKEAVQEGATEELTLSYERMERDTTCSN